jgi:flagellar biosynthesis/type III secretory pathway protein FliH
MSSSELVIWDPPDLDPAARAGAVPAPPAPADGGWAPPSLDEAGGPAGRAPRRTHAEDAYERGRDDGLTMGLAKAEARMDAALDALSGAVQKVREVEREFAAERERGVMGLALAVARQLTQQEMESRPEVLQALIARAIELVPAEAPIEFRMNPADLEAISGALERLAVSGRAPAAQWIGDPAIERGGFLLETPHRIVDGRVDVALRQLFERLTHE